MCSKWQVNFWLFLKRTQDIYSCARFVRTFSYAWGLFPNYIGLVANSIGIQVIKDMISIEFPSPRELS